MPDTATITLDHVALHVIDLEGMKDFYVKYFGCMANQQYHNPRTGLRSYFLSWEEGARIELISRPEVTSSRGDIFRQGQIHIALKVGSTRRVDELTRILENDGHTIHSRPRHTGDGYYESVILDPEGNIVEITA